MRILSLDGGGYLGLATAAFLHEMERHFNAKCSDRFEMFCGTSTGSIIALALASGKSASEVVELYKLLGAQVFPSSISRLWKWPKIAWSLARSTYGNEELYRCLFELFGETTLGDLSARGKYVMVPAFCLTTGRPRVFKTDHAAGLTAHSKYRLVDIAMASSAAPIVLPLVNIPNPVSTAIETFCDGGVLANHPAMLGLIEALHTLKVDSGKIRLLSVSTPRKSLSSQAVHQKSLRRGLWGWGDDLAGTLIDSNSMISHETLRRLVKVIQGEPVYERIELKNEHCLEMDDSSGKATQQLLTIGSTEGQSGLTRDRMKRFFEGE